jgi:hypothetical protein
MQGKFSQNGACQYTGPDGQTFIGEYAVGPDKPPTWTFIGGTGKWKGISGGGAYKTTVMGKPFADGSGTICLSHQGKYTLPE